MKTCVQAARATSAAGWGSVLSAIAGTMLMASAASGQIAFANGTFGITHDAGFGGAANNVAGNLGLFNGGFQYNQVINGPAGSSSLGRAGLGAFVRPDQSVFGVLFSAGSGVNQLDTTGAAGPAFVDIAFDATFTVGAAGWPVNGPGYFTFAFFNLIGNVAAGGFARFDLNATFTLTPPGGAPQVDSLFPNGNAFPFVRNVAGPFATSLLEVNLPNNPLGFLAAGSLYNIAGSIRFTIDSPNRVAAGPNAVTEPEGFELGQASGIPGPGAASLLLLGGALAARRRR